MGLKNNCYGCVVRGNVITYLCINCKAWSKNTEMLKDVSRDLQPLYATRWHATTHSPILINICRAGCVSEKVYSCHIGGFEMCLLRLNECVSA